eukprot:2148143-Rhodomonas_salina.2
MAPYAIGQYRTVHSIVHSRSVPLERALKLRILQHSLAQYQTSRSKRVARLEAPPTPRTPAISLRPPYGMSAIP